MKFEDLKRIADARTKGIWKFHNNLGVIYVSDGTQGKYANFDHRICESAYALGRPDERVPNHEFIATFANHADTLLEIMRAARALKGDLDAHDESPTHFCSYFALTYALKDLEKIT